MVSCDCRNMLLFFFRDGIDVVIKSVTAFLGIIATP